MKQTQIRMLMSMIIGSILSVHAHGQNYSIVRSSFPDGYALSTSGNRFALSSVGEAFAGRIQATPLVLQSGFLAGFRLSVMSTASLTMLAGWNMVSVPLDVLDYTKTTLFPTAVSDAFAYQGAYVVKTVLENGVGYWLRFSSAQNVPVTGFLRDKDTIAVQSGWNMIGSISSPVNVTMITSIPGGIVTSQFFGYNGAYVTASTIEPGKAYWVRTTQAGQLILSALALTEGHIQIEPTQENPPTPPLPTVLGEDEDLPTEFALLQNYPNPFNPSTTIRYQLPVPARVSLRVYNILGQVVATLVDEVQEAGYKSVVWNAGHVASGVYFFRLQSASFVQTRKMILQR